LPLGWYGLLPLLAVLVVTVVLVLAWSRSGETITLRFTEGHGLKAGDAVRCRGIIIGEVRKVWLDTATGDVLVQAVLNREAGDVARANSRFWIARPQADLASGISGLDTVIGAKYIHAEPGEGERQNTFVGLEAPPIPETIEKDGLKVVLLAHRLAGLRPGTPVTFRQVRVGSVLSVALASDASAVEVNAYIRPAYARLVRENSQFWNTSGVRLEWQLLRPLISVESAESVLMGGIALATPDPPGKAVGPGHPPFRLLSEEPRDAQQWKPSLPLIDARLPVKAIMSRPIAAALEYELPGYLWGKSTYPPRRGLVVPIGRDLLGPSDLLTVPVNGKGELRLDVQPPATLKVEPGGTALAVMRLASALARARGPAPELRAPTGPEECLLVGAADQEPRAVSIARLEEKEGRWQGIAELLRDTSPQEWRRQWHGAAVVARKDGAVIGLLMVPEGRKPEPYVIPLDRQTAKDPVSR
jgi:hypothetical protein